MRARQLYVGGELLGGCDIVDDLAQSGSLRSAVDEALDMSPAATAAAAAAAAPPAGSGAGAAAAANGGASKVAAAPSAGTPPQNGAASSSHAGAATAAAKPAASGGGASEQELRALLAQQPVMLFMKARPRLAVYVHKRAFVVLSSVSNACLVKPAWYAWLGVRWQRRLAGSVNSAHHVIS